MNESVRITVLVENSVQSQGLAAEHGLSVHIRIGQRCVLFDTGPTDLIQRNAQALGISLNELDAIVLSHGHYDHTGGLDVVLQAATNARLYLHPAALEAKYSKKPESEARFIGMSGNTAQALRRRGFTASTGWTRVSENVFVTGQIPRVTGYEDTGGPFFLDSEGQRPDPLTDDQALVIDLGRSVLLLLGCAHAGVVNTLDYVEQMMSGRKTGEVMGGFHLGSASEERIERTIARLRAANLTCLAPMHCTGWPATPKLWRAFPEIIRSAGVGAVPEFERV